MESICNIILDKKDDDFIIITIPILYCKLQDNYLMCFSSKNELIACFDYFKIIGFYITEG